MQRGSGSVSIPLAGCLQFVPIISPQHLRKSSFILAATTTRVAGRLSQTTRHGEEQDCNGKADGGPRPSLTHVSLQCTHWSCVYTYDGQEIQRRRKMTTVIPWPRAAGGCFKIIRSYQQPGDSAQCAAKYLTTCNQTLS